MENRIETCFAIDIIFALRNSSFNKIEFVLNLKTIGRENPIARFFVDNRYTLAFFVLLVISAVASIWLVYTQMVKLTNTDSSVPNHVIKTLVDAMLLMSPMFLFKRRGLIFIVLALVDVFCLSAVWYYRNYLDIIPFSSFLLFENVSPMLLDSALASARWCDWLALLPTLVTGVVYKLFLQKRVRAERRRQWKPTAAIVGIAVAFYAVLAARDVKLGVFHSFTDRFVTYPNNILYIDQNGLCGYTLYQIVTSLIPEPELSAEERVQIESFLDDYPHYTNSLCPANEQKNLVLIIVESLNSWVIGKSFDGMEVTPCLNRIVNDSNSISAVHMLAQVKDGRSSDGQFMYNTGLLPLRSGAVATRYGQLDYYSIAKALKRRGYTTVNMTVDRNNYWNQSEVSVAYGYDRNLDRLKGSSNIGNSVPDSVLVVRSIEQIKAEKGPFFYQLITGSSHKPFKEPAHKTVLSRAEGFPTEVHNYMEIIHYTDRCIGAFIDSLRVNGLYENTVVAIVSDHNQLLEPCTVPGYNDTEVAFIVANAGVKHVHEAVMGQIDVYPTLLDVMGCNDYGWKGLGYSILRTPVQSAVGWDGSVAGVSADSLVSRQTEVWEVSEQMVTRGYFSTKQ